MDLGAPDIQRHYVRLTNNGKIDFTDRHDGVPVCVEPGRTENFPLDMAAHFFGYHLDATADQMFRHTCKRQGWNTPAHLVKQESGKTLAEELFASLKIEPVIYRLVEQKPYLDAPIAADPQPPVLQPPKLDKDELPPLPKRHKGAA
jgi:hypothetical protein